MKRMLVLVAAALSGASSADERPTLRDREAPRATDLLRAEKLAEQAQKRLELPAPRHRARWKRGGSSWNVDRREPAERSEPVIINVRPPLKRRGGGRRR